jgi:hypothetical protein
MAPDLVGNPKTRHDTYPGFRVPVGCAKMVFLFVRGSAVGSGCQAIPGRGEIP